MEKLKSLIDSCLTDKTPDVLLLCETWLNPFSPNIAISGYEFYRSDRQNKKGGGVTILTSTSLTHKLVKLKKTCFSYESIIIEITINPGKRYYVGVFTDHQTQTWICS